MHTHTFIAQHEARVHAPCRIADSERFVSTVAFAWVRRFEAQHLMHALTRNNVRKWVALSEGAGGSVGWLTVRGSTLYLHEPLLCKH